MEIIRIENGLNESIVTWENSIAIGKQILYYPNGNLQSERYIQGYIDTYFPIFKGEYKDYWEENGKVCLIQYYNEEGQTNSDEWKYFHPKGHEISSNEYYEIRMKLRKKKN